MDTISIQGIGLVSPIGIGFDEFSNNVRSNQRANKSDISFAGPRLPDSDIYAVENFDVREYLGKKGVSSLDRATQLSVVACGLAIQHAGLEVSEATQRGVGVVIGNASGNFKGVSDFIQDTYSANPPYMVSALQVPNTVMNTTAGQCAIWHRLKGVNSTVCAGRLTGLAVLQYAIRMLRLGHADTLIAGAVEECSDFTAWAKESLADSAAPPLGEGAVLFVLSKNASNMANMADICSVKVATVPSIYSDANGFSNGFRACIERALTQAGITMDQLDWWSGQMCGPKQLDEVESQVVNTLRTEAGVKAFDQPIVVSESMGQTYAAGAGFQTAALLAAAPTGLGLVTALGRQGQVGCAVLRVNHHAAQARAA